MIENRFVENNTIPTVINIGDSGESTSNFIYQNNERKRIARELHDGIGSLLSTTILLFDTVEPVNQQRYKEVRALLSETQLELRRIVYNLMPATLEKLGLIPAIQQLCEYLNKSERLKINLHCNSWEWNPAIQYLETEIYRIVQELVQNAVKHAQADALNLKLECTKKMTIISLEDNGIGFAKENKENMSLMSRVETLNGALKIEELAVGTRILVELPLK